MFPLGYHKDRVCQSEIVCVGRQEAEQQRLQRHSEWSCRAGKTVSLLKP